MNYTLWGFDISNPETKDLFIEVIGGVKSVDGEIVRIDPFIFLDSYHGPIRVQMFGGKPWAAYLGPNGQWVSKCPMSKDEVFQCARHALPKEQFKLYPTPM